MAAEMNDDIDMMEEDDVSGVNITPVVDVALVLLMIFLVTSPFFIKDLLPVSLPKAVSSETEASGNITVSISPDLGFAVNEVPVLRANLIKEMKRAIRNSNNRVLLIRADERVPSGEVEDVMKISRKMKIRRIAFATLPKTS